jgi:hypothetical protein
MTLSSHWCGSEGLYAAPFCSPTSVSAASTAGRYGAVDGRILSEVQPPL